MINLTLDKNINNIIHELEFKDVTELVKDSLITEILCRISNFSQETDHFENKYSKTFIEFKEEYENGEEDFDKYDDVMAWEFARQGKNYWTKKLDELKSVL